MTYYGYSLPATKLENCRPEFQDFLDRFYRSNNMMKEHIIYRYMMEESHDGSVDELCMVIHIMTDHWNTFIDSTRKERMLIITDTWVAPWLASPAVIRRFYQGNNPIISSSIALMG